MRIVAFIVISLASNCAIGSGASEPISLQSFLHEMLDRDRLARLPVPTYICKQASSYDRASIAPDKPGWFANNDFGQYIRTDQINGRTEYVVMDADGPGAIVRFWKGGEDPSKILRIYLDGSKTPAIEEKAQAFLGGRLWAKPPLAAIRARGFNLYLPIPYAKHCKVTFEGKPDWYNIEYRTYPAGTDVRTFTRANFDSAAELIERVGETLLTPVNSLDSVTRTMPARHERLAPGKEMKADIAGPAAIRLLRVKIDAPDLTQALRSTVLSIEFDGQQTIWCPVGDFFGSGVGLNPYRDWNRDVDRTGLLSCYWVMPFEKSCTIRLTNCSQQPVNATLGAIGLSDWKWDERSMHFHATWRQQYPINTKKAAGTMDWNYVEIAGRGVYVGDTLAVHNGSSAWWGEGDEKIYIDGEKFPSHFGTGTEDFYGYSYGHPAFFEAPFHAQPRFEGNNHVGHTTDTRTRSLDAIPFDKSLKLDLEIWHWEATRVAYAAATFWYARPGAASNRKPVPEEAARSVPGAATMLEGEGMRIIRKTGGITEIQSEPRWSGGQQLWWRDGKVGDRLELSMPVPADGEYSIVMQNTRAFDYGTFQFYVDGAKLGPPIDLYGRENIIRLSSLGSRRLSKGDHVFAPEIVGANPQAAKRYMLGLDYLRLERQD